MGLMGVISKLSSVICHESLSGHNISLSCNNMPLCGNNMPLLNATLIDIGRDEIHHLLLDFSWAIFRVIDFWAMNADGVDHLLGVGA